MTPSLIALVVLTFVVFTREFGRLAEILIRKNASPFTVFQILFSILPGVLIFTVPFAFLIGTLIGIGRLSSDSEIVAMQASGVSTDQLLWPVLKAGILVGILTLLLTLVFFPKGSWALRNITHQIGLRPVQSEIKPRVFNEELPGLVLYVEDVHIRNSSLKGVFMADTSTEGEKRIILAKDAYPLFSLDSRRLQLHFESGLIYEVDPKFPKKNSIAKFHTLDVPINLPATMRVEVGPKKPQDKSVIELVADLESGEVEPERLASIEFQRRIALPISALIFAVLGLTLGMKSPRGARGYGFIISLGIAFTYYVFFATGIQLAENKTVSIGWGVWGANALFGTISFLNFRYAERHPWIFAIFKKSQIWLKLLEIWRVFVVVMGWLFQGLRGLFSTSVAPRPQFGRVIDLYIFRSCILYFFLTFGICAALFYLFTFFDLIDDVFANQLSYMLVLEYFFYLFPYVVVRLVPISILIAAIVTLGFLDRTNQVIALKACGVSIYRIAIPVMAMALMVSGLIFVLQDYVLPYANQRQDSIRNAIKGRPAQTHYQLGFSWIFGKENRLYHYNYFDPASDLFAEISIYELDIQRSRLHRQIYAKRAKWDQSSHNWILSEGWERRFDENEIKFSTFSRRQSNLIEEPNYFEKELRESSKMTYSELKNYILGLQLAGFEVDHLKTELYKKTSFPLVSFIMSILSVPFAFSIGKKGALYGIAMGVVLGIVYWGAFGLFGLLGSSGLLSPLLAAYAPNLIFISVGILMFSTVKT